MKPTNESPPAVADSPVYWFTLMELGRGYGDFAQAARAKAELERLGIRVTYRPLRDRQEAAGD